MESSTKLNTDYIKLIQVDKNYSPILNKNWIVNVFPFVVLLFCRFVVEQQQNTNFFYLFLWNTNFNEKHLKVIYLKFNNLNYFGIRWIGNLFTEGIQISIFKWDPKFLCWKVPRIDLKFC